MTLKITGKITEILEVQSGTSKAGKAWQKQEFVIETEEQFPRNVCFTLFNDKTNLLEGYKKDDKVDVSFNLESREFNGRWYHNINAWKIEKEEQLNSPAPPEYQSGDIPPEQEEFNDLPF